MQLNRLYFLLFIFIFACQEDKDENPPLVVIESPDENTTAKVGESFLVKAHVQDDEGIESVRLSLINTNTKVSVEGTKNFRPNAKSYELNYQFALTNPQMGSGAYYFEVVATDKDNKASAFRSVLVNQVPRVLKGILLATKNSGATHLKVLEVNQTNARDIASLTVPIKSAVLNNLYQQLWVIPKGSNDVQLFDLNEETVTHSISAPLSPKNDAFAQAQLNENLLYLADYSGLINAYSTSFSDRFTYNSDGQTYVETFDIFQDRIFIAEQGNGVSGSLLRSIWKGSGGVIESANLNRNIQHIIALEGNSALLLSNQSGNTLVEEFFFSNASLVSIASISNDLIFDAIQLSQEKFILASRQAVYHFDYRRKNVSPIMSGNVKAISFDESRNEFLVAHDNYVSIYSSSSLQQINSYQISNEEVMFAAYWYNR
jgi:hypothetical protein